MKSSTQFSAAVIGACILAALPFVAEASVAVPIQSSNSIQYVNGGIGMGQERAIEKDAKAFPLRMTFSERKNGEFIADVPVVITNMHGKQIFELSKAGPMLDVKLPPGAYKVSATFRGKTETRRVTLSGKDHRNVHFHWNERPKA